MRIAIAYNEVLDASSPDDRDVIDQLDAVSESLVRLGHVVRTIPVTLDLAALKKNLTSPRADLVFNLVETLDGTGRLVSAAPLVFDALGLTYTGSSAEALFVSSNKVLAKRQLDAAGLPTPAWVQPSDIDGAPGPAIAGRWIVKSVWEHASIGMDDDVVFEPANRESLAQRIRDLVPQMGRAAFAEQFVAGREFNVALLDGQVLPPVEIRFLDFPADKPQIVGYRAKWAPGSFEYENTVPSSTFGDADTALLRRLADLSVQAWRCFELGGYARVDFRVDEDGQPWILEVNANPCLSPDAGFLRSVRLAGLSMDDAITKIVGATK